VNFSVIRDVGESAGLTTETFATQRRYLTELIAELMTEPWFHAWFAPQTGQFQTLTHPEHLGQTFRVLVQAR
jgi:SAM-dependent MidA family methyltransferase